MQGVVYLGESQVEVRQFEQPEPGLGQVLVAMRVAGLCGSDLHRYHNDRVWAQSRQGMISGHEPVGVVAALGADVAHLSIGQRVCVYHRVGCGYCVDCLSGYAAYCPSGGAFGRTQDGSHADYMLTEARYCLPLPDQLSLAVGTQLTCTAGTAFAALRKIPTDAGDTLVVFGLGPVGLAALLMGIGMGYRGIGVDVQPYRIALAEKVGQGLVIDAAKEDPVAALRDLSGGKGIGGVLECSGNGLARRQAAAVASRGATVVYVGGGGDPDLRVDIGDLIGRDITLRGNSVYSIESYFAAVEFLCAQPVPLDQIVTHRFKIEQAVEAFALFDSGQTGKVVFAWDA